MENAEQSIYNIRQGRESNGPAKVSEVIVNDVYTKLAQITGDDKEKYKGIPSGFGMLDKMLTGLNKGNLILIGARPAMGKTSFALNLAQNITMGARKKVYSFQP